MQAALRAMAAEGAGSSQTPACAIVLDEPPSADAGEITDKGYITQRAVLTLRHADKIRGFEAERLARMPWLANRLVG